MEKQCGATGEKINTLSLGSPGLTQTALTVRGGLGSHYLRGLQQGMCGLGWEAHALPHL